MLRFSLRAAVVVVAGAWSATSLGDFGVAAERLELRPHDRIAFVGGSLAERMRLYGNLEARLHLSLPRHELVVRNFGWPCDEVGHQQRPDDYTKLDDPLAVFAPNVFFCFFGFNESFAGEAGVPRFEADYRKYLAELREKFAVDGEPLRFVLVSPIAFEPTGEPLQPNGEKENANLRMYAEAVKRTAAAEGMAYVDLFSPTLDVFGAEPGAQFTINGAHLNGAGDQLISQAIAGALIGNAWIAYPSPADRLRHQVLRDAVVDMEWHHHQDYRMINGWYVYGSRSRPLDTDTFRPEYAKIRKMCADRDRVIWALARGETPPDIDDAEPTLPEIPTVFGTKPYSEPKELRILSPKEAEAAMTVTPGYRVQTFASEADFPELAKPVQMAFDNRGRLWAACMPTYPQWRPGDGRPTDRLMIFEDDDGDGRADKAKVFADKLHCPVGFEFFNGGVLVVSQPKILFLKDTDGDDRADVREVVLDGFASDDTHHAISAFEWTPDGRLVMLEGIMMSTAVETPWGPFRNKNQSVAYTLDPRRWRVSIHITPCFANPWCYTHNDWGQGFVGDGTQASQHWATPLNGAAYAGRRSNEQFIHYDGNVMRPALGNGFLFSRHFPDSAQGNFFYACVINMNGILQFKVEDDGSGYRGERIEDLVNSTDRNFRPGDPQIGPDGALYFIDWHNPLIGHMQYSQRDPNRDHEHGRIYRLYAEGLPLVKPVTQAGKPIPELLEQLREYEPQTTYRVRRELRDRPTADVTAAVKTWVGSIADNDPHRDKLLCEAMWVLAGHHVVDRPLLHELLQASTPDARAAAVHIVADQREWIPDALALATSAVNDPHPRVRVEALRALSFFPEIPAVQAALAALDGPLDRELSYTLESTVTALRPTWEAAQAQGVDLVQENAAAGAFLERIAAGNDRGREVKSLVDNILQQEHPGMHASAIARLVSLPANAGEGQKVFQRSCRACHRVGVDGAVYGPDLSDVGKRLSREEILQSILFPNRKVEEKYRATNIFTDDGKAVSGLVLEDNDREVSLLVGQGTVQKIPKEHIQELRQVDVSSMPERLNESMSGNEFLDLLEFLARQQTTPEASGPAASGGR
jgi:putative heme-binding domain-containing protein